MSIDNLPLIDELISLKEFNSLKKRIEYIEDYLSIYPDKTPKCSKCGHFPEINYDKISEDFKNNGYEVEACKNGINSVKINRSLFQDDYHYIIFQPFMVIKCDNCSEQIRYVNKPVGNIKKWEKMIYNNKLNNLWLIFINKYNEDITNIVDKKSKNVNYNKVICYDNVTDNCGLQYFLQYNKLTKKYIYVSRKPLIEKTNNYRKELKKDLKKKKERNENKKKDGKYRTITNKYF